MSGTTPGDCLNCGESLSGPYCAACGQKVAAPNPTFGDLLHEYTHELLHVDGRLYRSIRLLLTRPGELTKEYCRGRRIRYLSPLRLYLIFSVLFFATAALSPERTSVRQDAKRGEVVETGGVKISGELFLGKLTPQQIEDRVRTARRVWLPRLMLALVPVWALLVMLVTRREKRHYPEHLTFSLHTHAAFSGAFMVVNLARLLQLPTLNRWMGFAGLLYVIWYTLIGLHRVYGGTWLRAVTRTVGITASYLIILFITFIGFFTAALLL